ncbi:MAG: chloride channel protein, partial [Actinomycetota bacterium]
MAESRVHRFHIWIALAVMVGISTGLVVAGVHFVVETLLWEPLDARSDWWIPLLPMVGLVLAVYLVRLTRSRSTDTTEEYIEAFHGTGSPIRMREVPARLLASISTIGLGGSMGLEGPSIYSGSAIGDWAERRYPKLLRAEHAKVLLVAGAAAGVSAIFKAPLTGIVFALEVPYRDDLARRALIPAVFASTSSYLVFAGLQGTRPFFPVHVAGLSYSDLLVSVGVGVFAGLAARAFVWFTKAIRALEHHWPPVIRAATGGIVLAAVGYICLHLFHSPLALGPGYRGMLLAARGQLSLGLLCALLVLKMVATAATAGSEGVGGLFFPSAM